MLKRALYFSNPFCLSLRNGQMIIHTREAPEEIRRVPIEDIGVVVLEDQQTSITLPLLNALSDNNVAVIFCGDNRLPKYPNQTIWPYSDFIQHKLHMENDIRTGWCRTTPLWGRGLHQMCTGSATADRLHDNRARNVIEAIMWHGNAQSDARKSVEKFRELPKEDRDAIVKFIDAI